MPYFQIRRVVVTLTLPKAGPTEDDALSSFFFFPSRYSLENVQIYRANMYSHVVICWIITPVFRKVSACRRALVTTEDGERIKKGVREARGGWGAIQSVVVQTTMFLWGKDAISLRESHIQSVCAFPSEAFLRDVVRGWSFTRITLHYKPSSFNVCVHGYKPGMALCVTSSQAFLFRYRCYTHLIHHHAKYW